MKAEALEVIKWVFMIMIADLLAIFIHERWKQYRDRKLDLGCDSCEIVAPLARTPDRTFYLCRRCYQAYVEEHNLGSSAQTKKAFRRIKRRKK